MRRMFYVRPSRIALCRRVQRIQPKVHIKLFDRVTYSEWMSLPKGKTVCRR